ncbi:MAG: Tex-like N-terminal domain-containing protein [Kofleriaceae bacterium]
MTATPPTYDPVPDLAAELGLAPASVAAAVALFADGATVPFIARYRKEKTGGLDEVALRAIEERHGYLAEREARRAAIRAELTAAGVLTDELAARLAAATTKAELEDLYAPFRPRRKTRASTARARGLAPLAARIAAQPADGDPAAEAAAFVAGEVASADDALAGARDIVAEEVTDRADVRALVRAAYAAGTLTAEGVADQITAPTKYEAYYAFAEPVATIPSHRFLAIRRGEAEGILRATIVPADGVDAVVEGVLRLAGHAAGSPWGEQLAKAVADGYRRLLAPAVENDLRAERKAAADLEAAGVFAGNLRALLLGAPLGAKRVIGIDPGLRTGCKCAAVDATGRYLGSVTIYLTQGEAATARAKAELAEFITKHDPVAIAVGNGTGGREAEVFTRRLIGEAQLGDRVVVAVNEAGASVYSASDLAREEFPDLDLTIRGAISIARRLQDPLAELVKIEPKAIGVGQYQHDVHGPLLTKKLGDVVESCVNFVGVDLNTASPSLLGYVAGIGPALANKIVAFRHDRGGFASRAQLLEVGGLGPKAFEQCAGFLRIRGGAQPLDASAVHPESYPLVERLAADLGVEVVSLLGNAALIDTADRSRYVGGEVGDATVRDILAELGRPGRDPRALFEPPKFRDDVMTLDDVKEGMVLEGLVTNVAAFGAFVDVGVHQDGLIHVSRLANRFVKDAAEVVKVGDKVTVRVLGVDLARRRIALAVHDANAEGSRGPRGPRGPRPDGAGRGPRGHAGRAAVRAPALVPGPAPTRAVPRPRRASTVRRPTGPARRGGRAVPGRRARRVRTGARAPTAPAPTARGPIAARAPTAPAPMARGRSRPAPRRRPRRWPAPIAAHAPIAARAPTAPAATDRAPIAAHARTPARAPIAVAPETTGAATIAPGATTAPAWASRASSTTRSRSLRRSRTSAELAAALALAALVACRGKARPAADDAGAGGPPSDASALADAGRLAVDAAAPPRPEQAVFSLGDNLLAAHRLVDGDLVIDAGSIGFARYTRLDTPVARWRYRRVVLGQRVAQAARGGSIEVPLTEAQAAAAAGLAVQLVAERASKVTIRVGLRAVGRIAVEPGRQVYTVATPAGTWRPGENPIVFDGPVALASVRVVAAGARNVDDDRPADHARWDDQARALALDDGAGVAWYAHLPPDAHLVATVAGPCRIEVDARTDDGVRAGGLLGGGIDRIDLAAVGDRPVRLALQARDCPTAVLADPVITVPGAPVAAPAPGPAARYVVLWIMDALRADRVRPFQPGARAEVPNLEALAQTSAVFRQYYVHGNESQTSHASLWTSTYPAIHNVRQAGVGGSWRIPRGLPVLGELVAAAGLTPIAVTGNGFVTNLGGYGRGFEEFRNMMREKGVVNGVLYGAEVLRAATARLTAHRDHPTLLFLGTVDTHGPWMARKPWIDRYSSPSYRGPFQTHGTMRELGIRAGKMGCSKIPPPADIERLRAIYDSAISYHDERLGELVASLKRLGIYDQTMIVVTADHGEELFEDGRCGHGGSLRDSLVRVPLLIHYPPRIQPGVVEEGVEEVDVLPTILDAVGAAPVAALQGASLAPLSAGIGRGWLRPSYASQYEYAHAMRIGRWKLKVGKHGVPTTLDVVGDPDERVDLSTTRPAVRRLLTDALGLFLATRTRWHKPTMGVVTNLAPGAAALLEQGP